MSRLLQALFGRLPIGWLQLTHNRTRFAAALAGVAFANVLVFVQLGIMNSMGAATLRPYDFFQADIMISAGDSNALTDGGNVARQWLLQAMADPDVDDGMGLFLANVPWDRGEKDISLSTFGVDPAKPGFIAPEIGGDLNLLQVQDAAVLDRLARGLGKDEAAAIRPQSPLSFETQGRTLTAYATFAGGGGFGGDGYMLVSDQTFLSLFPARSSAAPDHILLTLRPGAQPEAPATPSPATPAPQTSTRPAPRRATRLESATQPLPTASPAPAPTEEPVTPTPAPPPDSAAQEPDTAE